MSTSQTPRFEPRSRVAAAGDAMTYTLGVRTDKGMQRSANEDAVAVLEVPGADTAFVVADGMGGLRAGDIASNEAVRVVQETLAERVAVDAADLDAILADAIRRANDAVNALARPEMPTGGSDDAGGGQTTTVSGGLMGTTCVLGVVRAGVLHLAHVGDSRAYLFRDGALTRITEDHSFVADRVRAGDMTEAEARTSRFRNMITRAIGIEPDVHPDLRQEPLQPGDTVLVCSDGLTTMLEDEEIAALLSARHTARLSPDRAASALVDAANKKGGHDNITVVLLRSHQPGQEDALAAPTTSVTDGNAAPRPARGRGGAVIDMDRPTVAPIGVRTGGIRASSLSAAWPLLVILALLGVLAIVAAGAVAASPNLRARVVAALGGGGGAPTPAPSLAPPVDLAHVTYGAPEDFSSFLARGDLLTYSPGAGLFFVADSSGKVVSLSKTGQPLHTVENLTPAPPAQTPVPDTHVFMTTDVQGNIYISFTRRRMIEKRSADGALLQTITGLTRSTRIVNGKPRQIVSGTGFVRPEAIAVDENGDIFVVDMNVIKILRARPAGAPASPAAVAPSAGAAAAVASPASSAASGGG